MEQRQTAQAIAQIVGVQEPAEGVEGLLEGLAGFTLARSPLIQELEDARCLVTIAGDARRPADNFGQVVKDLDPAQPPVCEPESSRRLYLPARSNRCGLDVAGHLAHPLDGGVSVADGGNVVPDGLEAREPHECCADVLDRVGRSLRRDLPGGVLGGGRLVCRAIGRVGLDVDQLPIDRHVGAAAAQRIRRRREGLVVQVAAIAECKARVIGSDPHVLTEQSRCVLVEVFLVEEEWHRLPCVVEHGGLERERERRCGTGREGKQLVVALEVVALLTRSGLSRVDELQQRAVARLRNGVVGEPYRHRTPLEIRRRDSQVNLLRVLRHALGVALRAHVLQRLEGDGVEPLAGQERLRRTLEQHPRAEPAVGLALVEQIVDVGLVDPKVAQGVDVLAVRERLREKHRVDSPRRGPRQDVDDKPALYLVRVRPRVVACPLATDLAVDPLAVLELSVAEVELLTIRRRRRRTNQPIEFLDYAVDVDGQRDTAVHHDREAHLLRRVVRRTVFGHGTTKSEPPRGVKGCCRPRSGRGS